MNTFSTSQTLGDIVAMMPKASDIFKAYNIDFCCGGHRTLSEAVKEQNLNENEVLQKLDRAYRETENFSHIKDFRNVSSSELIDYIISTHHAFLRRTLPEVSELTTKIMRVHGPNHEELFKVHRLFHNLKTELEQHLIKEEEILFPLIKDYDRKASEETLNKFRKVMKETEDEHTGAGDILKELRKITNDYSVPADGCGSFHLTYRKLQDIESDLFEHIHLENNILFRRYSDNCGCLM